MWCFEHSTGISYYYYSIYMDIKYTFTPPPLKCGVFDLVFYVCYNSDSERERHLFL